MSKSAAAVVLPVEKKAAAPGAPSPAGPTVGGGSQLETAVERGDYTTHQQALGDQASETSGHAPDGTKPRGSQVHSMELQDVSYPQGGAGGAKIADRSRELIIALAKNNPKGVEILADHIRLADATPMGTAASAPGNVGAPVGGTPDAIEEADEELEATPPEAAPAPGGAPGVPTAQDPTAVHLQDKIQEKTDQLNMEQEVVRELKDVMTEVQAAKDPKKEKADKAKAEKEKADKAKEKAEKKDKAASTKTAIEKDDQSKKVPHASIDPDEHDQKPEPDQALYTESKGKSKSTPESATGQQFAEFKDKDYTLAQKVKRAQRLLAQEAIKLVEAGMSQTAALKQVMATKLGKAVTSASLEVKKQAGEESPADKDPSGPLKNTYSGEDAGDQGTDEISKGTDTRYESPETAKVVDQARSKLDAKHNADSQGSTTAARNDFFTLNERKKLVAEVKETDNTYDAFKQVAIKMLSEVANPEVSGRVKAVTSSTLRDLKAAGDKLEAVLKSTTGEPVDVRRKAAHAAIENRLRREAAHEKATMIAAMATESAVQASRLSRVPEALKLALAMVQKGHISIEQAPTKLSEFMKMGSKEFVTVRQYALELPATNGRSAQGLKTASRLPNFGQESVGPRDELDGIFD